MRKFWKKNPAEAVPYVIPSPPPPYRISPEIGGTWAVKRCHYSVSRGFSYTTEKSGYESISDAEHALRWFLESKSRHYGHSGEPIS